MASVRACSRTLPLLPTAGAPGTAFMSIDWVELFRLSVPPAELIVRGSVSAASALWNVFFDWLAFRYGWHAHGADLAPGAGGEAAPSRPMGRSA
jgi:hypothetical protein